MLNLKKIPFEFDRLFRKQSHQDKESVPLENPDNIVTFILDAACAMADAVGLLECKGLFLFVTVEKEVTVSHSEYVGMLKAKQDEMFCKVRDEVVRMLQLEDRGQEFPKSEWDNMDMVNVLLKSGLSQELKSAPVAGHVLNADVNRLPQSRQFQEYRIVKFGTSTLDYDDNLFQI
ncbi:hypothetical protein CRYUN_Cryun07bG0162700 [Craigia yunnanensis]